MRSGAGGTNFYPPVWNTRKCIGHLVQQGWQTQINVPSSCNTGSSATPTPGVASEWNRFMHTFAGRFGVSDFVMRYRAFFLAPHKMKDSPF